MNTTFVVGNVVKKSALRNVQVEGRPTSVINLQVATRNGGERTTFQKVVVWGNDAKAVDTYCSIGRTVSLQGHTKAAHWVDGQGVIRSWTEVHTNFVEFLNYGRGDAGPVAPLAEDIPTPADEEEIPF